ncbi:hypothetical protein ACIOJF_02480 [Glutamicibacter sp. NPDC087831]|uniref:hypothetical protein n=1 Tax=Glutamicibacter sp. NPDC087831 TaxID=3363998 RepID=UPI00382086E6
MDWTIITSVLGGAVGASIITAFVNWRIKVGEERNSHTRWLRDKKIEFYSEALQIFVGVRQQTDVDWIATDKLNERRDEVLKANTQLALLAPIEVHNNATAVVHSYFDRATEPRATYDEKLHKLQKSMREDLAVK